jgi:hypothetical protein
MTKTFAISSLPCSLGVVWHQLPPKLQLVIMVLYLLKRPRAPRTRRLLVGPRLLYRLLALPVTIHVFVSEIGVTMYHWQCTSGRTLFQKVFTVYCRVSGQESRTRGTSYEPSRQLFIINSCNLSLGPMLEMRLKALMAAKISNFMFHPQSGLAGVVSRMLFLRV